MAEKFAYDRSSKWLIQHYGDSILRLAGFRENFSCRAVQAEVVQPRQLPDGLLEVRVAQEPEQSLFIVEVATYPKERIEEQVLRNQMLVYLARGQLPEAGVLVLRPRVNVRAADGRTVQSKHGWSRWQANWRVVELWKVPAEDLLAANEVGLIPWVPLAYYPGPSETLLHLCRERIDQQAPANQHANLLAVTQVLARLQYDNPQLLTILGGTRAMIESPIIQELLDQRSQEVMQRDINVVLKARFGPVPEEVTSALHAIRDEEKLAALMEWAAQCLDLSRFRERLES